MGPRRAAVEFPGRRGHPYDGRAMPEAPADRPTGTERPTGDDSAPTAMPSLAARVLAFASILVGGLCGGLCKHDGLW